MRSWSAVPDGMRRVDARAKLEGRGVRTFLRDSVPTALREAVCGQWKTVKAASPSSIKTGVGRGQRRPSGVVSLVSSMNEFRIMSGM